MREQIQPIDKCLRMYFLYIIIFISSEIENNYFLPILLVICQLFPLKNVLYL